ncbi:hypothetical protein MVEN_01163100 [Mycena venus]|uniref:DUF6534 domain-containing protein n=1 Tax=Mycena venus TaxID=2733690 RepID=A0A8H6Y506_9AGAR|nr:hypothetical protein MVEN_01163100 [Mycena venus]
MSVPSMASTYGSWLISLFLETILYGIGILQIFLYFQWWWPTDEWSTKGPLQLLANYLTAFAVQIYFASRIYSRYHNSSNCRVTRLRRRYYSLSLRISTAKQTWVAKMLNTLMINAVNRGMLTAASSAVTMILFLIYPNTFWFFLSLALSSKLYMNSMLAT